MKRFGLSVAVLLLTSWVLVVAPAVASPERTLPDGAHMITFSVPDMECSMCSRSIQVEVKRVEGVLDIKTDDILRTTTVKFDPTRADVKKLQAAIKKAGFASHPIEPQKT